MHKFFHCNKRSTNEAYSRLIKSLSILKRLLKLNLKFWVRVCIRAIAR